MVFKYLDLPEIPEELIPSKQTIIDLPSKDLGRTSTWFRYKHTTKELHDYLQTLFDFEIASQFQVIHRDMPIHRDAGRYTCMNYILSPGGSNVATNFYEDDKKTIILSEIIKPKTWHTLLVHAYHNVTNVEHNHVRVEISCVPRDERKYALDTFNFTIPTP